MMRWLLILLLLAGNVALRAGDTPAGAPTDAAGEDALFGDMPEVIGAALHTQTLGGSARQRDGGYGGRDP